MPEFLLICLSELWHFALTQRISLVFFNLLSLFLVFRQCFSQLLLGFKGFCCSRDWECAKLSQCIFEVWLEAHPNPIESCAVVVELSTWSEMDRQAKFLIFEEESLLSVLACRLTHHEWYHIARLFDVHEVDTLRSWASYEREVFAVEPWERCEEASPPKVVLFVWVRVRMSQLPVFQQK